MKRLISILCTLAMLLALATVCVSAYETDGKYLVSDIEGGDKTATDTYCYGYIGDADFSDKITVRDATTIQKHVANLLTLKDTNSILADADMSGDVNVKDATTIQKWVAGIKVNAPVYHLLWDKSLSNDEHIHAYNISSQSANCKQEGYIQYTCKCGESYKTNETDKGEHNWGEWQVITPPTKDTYGESRSYCKNCDDFKPMMVDKIRDDASTTEPYFVSLEYVSETRPNTFYVDGMDVLSRVYGKSHYAYQTGDTITYRVNMSDGGKKGFEIYETYGCNAKVSGNNIIITITGNKSSASVDLLVNTKNGENYVRIGTLKVYKTSDKLEYFRSDLTRVYAENIGFTWVNGYTNPNGEFRTVPLNNMFNTMDELKNMGCTKFNYQIGNSDFQIIAGN